MERLNLPIIQGPTPESKRLSMDEYLKFVDFHLRYTFDEKAARQWKEMLAVDIPFVIKK